MTTILLMIPLVSSQELQQMENILLRRCPGCHSPAKQVLAQFAGDSLPVYKPYGENGPKVDMLSSVALINRFSLLLLYFYFAFTLLHLLPKIKIQYTCIRK